MFGFMGGHKKPNPKIISAFIGLLPFFEPEEVCCPMHGWG